MDHETVIRALTSQLKDTEARLVMAVTTVRHLKDGRLTLDRIELVGDDGFRILADVRAVPDQAVS